MRLKIRYVFPLLAMLIGALGATPAAAGSKVTLVASGLDSPRGIVFLGERAVVSESGHGGPDCFVAGEGKICVGNSSQISWVNTRNGNVTRLAGGFFSANLGTETLGVSGLSVMDGKLYAQISVTSYEVPSNIAIGQQAGDLIVVSPRNGTWEKVADVGDRDFEYASHLADMGVPQERDANPTGILATHHGILVADSGANTLSKVVGDKVRVVHYFPFRDTNFPTDEVPTCVASTDKALWVGTLAGHLYRVEEGDVTAVIPRDASGKPLLSHVTGCITGREGALYLVNMFGSSDFLNGSVVTYNTESGKGTMLADAFSSPLLFLPYTPAIGPDGNLYVTAGATCPATRGSLASTAAAAPDPCAKGGRVVMITLDHEEDHGRGNDR